MELLDFSEGRAGVGLWVWGALGALGTVGLSGLSVAVSVVGCCPVLSVCCLCVSLFLRID